MNQTKKLPDRKKVDGLMRCGTCEKVLESKFYTIDGETAECWLQCSCGNNNGYYWNGLAYPGGTKA